MPNHRNRKINHSLGSKMISMRFLWLLLVLVAMMGSSPTISNARFYDWESVLLLVVVLVTAIYAARGGIWRMLVSISLVVALVGCGIAYKISQSESLLIACLVLVIMSLLFAMSCILQFVLGTGSVNVDHIYGAICAYIFIGMIFATIHMIVEVIAPGSYRGLHVQKHLWWECFYYSFTTLSTVGYGDIIPVSIRARSISIIEMLTGTFYVTILIARLAGLYPPPKPEEEDNPEGDVFS